MKMHSYMTVNGALASASEQADVALAHLKDAVKKVGGWDQAVADAKARRSEFEETTAANTPGGTETGSPSSQIIPDGTTKSYVDAPTAAALRKRLLNVSSGAEVGAPVAEEALEAQSPEVPAYVLVDHPDSQVSMIAKDFVELDSELVSSGPLFVRWPENITLKNFALYQAVPTLVYELEYPRTDRFVYSRRRPLRRIDGFVGYDRYTFSKRQSVSSGPSRYFTPSRRHS